MESGTETWRSPQASLSAPVPGDSSLILGLVFSVAACAAPPCTVYEAGERSCSITGGTSHLTCRYLLAEIAEIRDAPAGIRTTGYLVRKNKKSHLAEFPDGSGTSFVISKLGPTVNDWMPDALVDQQQFSVVRGLYHQDIGTIEVISIGALNVPGWPEFEAPAPADR